MDLQVRVAGVLLRWDDVFLTFVVAGAVLLPLFLRLAGGDTRQRRWAVATTAAAALVPAGTLSRWRVEYEWPSRCYRSMQHWDRLDPEAVGNLALFVPVTVCLLRWLRATPVLVVAGVLVTSVAIERLQVLTQTGVCTPLDVYRNTSGAVLATVVIVLVRRRTPRAGPPSGTA